MNYLDLTRDLDNHQARAVMSSFEQALAYAWGRQDAGEPGGTATSEHFAWSFAMAKRAFVTEQHWMMTNLRDGYESWLKSRAVIPELLTCGKLGSREEQGG